MSFSRVRNATAVFFSSSRAVLSFSTIFTLFSWNTDNLHVRSEHQTEKHNITATSKYQDHTKNTLVYSNQAPLTILKLIIDLCIILGKTISSIPTMHVNHLLCMSAKSESSIILSMDYSATPINYFDHINHSNIYKHKSINKQTQQRPLIIHLIQLPFSHHYSGIF